MQHSALCKAQGSELDEEHKKRVGRKEAQWAQMDPGIYPTPSAVVLSIFLRKLSEQKVFEQYREEGGFLRGRNVKSVDARQVTTESGILCLMN